MLPLLWERESTTFQHSRSICLAKHETEKPEKFRSSPLFGGSVYFQALARTQCVFHCLRSLSHIKQALRPGPLYILLRSALCAYWACGKSNINSDVVAGRTKRGNLISVLTQPACDNRGHSGQSPNAPEPQRSRWTRNTQRV